MLPEREPAAGRVSAWRLAAVPFTVGVAVRVLVVALIQVMHGNFLFLDDQGYDRIGWELAQAWHMNMFPRPASVAVTESWFYYGFVAAVYFVIGRQWIVLKLIAALLSALSVPAAASVGVSLDGRRLGIRAAWLAALYPSAVFWGSTGLKDGPMATLLLAVAAIALQPLTMRRLACAVALLGVAFGCRPVEGAIGSAMLLVPAVSLLRSRWPGPEQRMRTGSRLFVLVAGLPATAVLLTWQAARYLPILTASMSGESTLSLSTGPIAVTYAPSPTDFAHAVLSPVRWFGPATDAVYVPGMLVWTVMLPAIALGCWLLLRHGTWAARGVLVSATGFMYLYTCVFQGSGFSRQRFTVEILFLVMGLYAFGRSPRRAATWTAIATCVTVPAELAAGVVPARILALAVITAGAAWLAVYLARTLWHRISQDRRVHLGQHHQLFPSP